MIEETEARGPVMNLLLDARVDLQAEWLRDGTAPARAVPRVSASA